MTARLPRIAGRPAHAAGLLVFLLAALAAAGPVAPPEAPGSGPAEARLLRFPDIHGDFVVFVYGGDIWRAPSAGGPAYQLTTHPGLELFPRISPDGQWIAFSAEYTGSRQVYVMPSWGGEPRQLTFYTDVGRMPPRGGWDYWIQDWTPDGKILVRANRTPWGERMGRYVLVDPAGGGLETPLPLPHGGSASLSPDATKIAYCPIDREFRTWKRTRGGRAQDVWVYDLRANRSERITDDPGTDNFPMWIGTTIWFTSDRSRILNLFAYDLRTKALRQVTHFTEGDVLWPSAGPGAIVFQQNGLLWRIDTVTERVEKIPIRIGSDHEAAVPHFKNVRQNITTALVSPNGKRALFEARGDLFLVPAKEGVVRNMTETQGVREHSPAWSPDGRSIAYLSDATGEYEIWVRPPELGGEARQVTKGGDIWLYPPVWSPDGKRLAFADRKQRLRIVDVDTGSITEVDRGDQEDPSGYAWSPDSRWLVYEKSQPTRLPGIYAYSVEQKRVEPLSDGLTFDSSPVFSKDGRYLFFLSRRDYRPSFSDFEFNYVFRGSTRIYVASLAADVPALFPPRTGDEEKPEAKADKDGGDAQPGQEGEKKDEGGTTAPPGDEEKEKDKRSGKEKEKEKEKRPGTGRGPTPSVTIEPDGFAARTVALPGVEAGTYSSLQVAKGAVFYLKDVEGSAPTLYRYDLEERKAEKVLSDIRSFDLSFDGESILYRSGSDYGITKAKADRKAGDGKLDVSDLRMKLDPRAEWRQMFDDAWRITRDWFYDPQMHGVDWAGLRKVYGALVPYVAHRSDLDFILGEMVSELESGHTYVGSGDEPHVERVRGGMLGCELEAEASGRYRIARIYPGENWSEDTRSPLTEPGVNVKEGEFLLAVDGHDLTTKDNPYRLLEGKLEQPVVLTIGTKPSVAGSRRVVVRPVGSELGLRYLAWVRERMALADRLSGGRVGYIHLPDTALQGNAMLQKLFYGQADKPALVIDDRYNGGGFIPDRMIEVLGRQTIAYWARRGVASERTPGFAHDGPKAMLINAYSSSGGDALPYFFRERGLGPIIGTRTWGGLIGLSGNPSLVDGGSVQVPTFRIYDTKGRWVVENEGVAPDVEVIDLPEAELAGHDPSLEKAIEMLLADLERRPSQRPSAPQPPVHRGSPGDCPSAGAGRQCGRSPEGVP